MIYVAEKRISEPGACDSCGEIIEPFELYYKLLHNNDCYCSDCMELEEYWEVVDDD